MTFYAHFVALLALSLIAISSASPISKLEEELLALNTSVRQSGLHHTDPLNQIAFALGGGYVRYVGFDANDRVKGASALINSDTPRPGSTPKPAIKPSGWNQIGVTGNQRQRCHLIGNQLGGSGRDARNLVTCHRHANSPVMRHYENRIRTLVDTFPTTGPWKRDKGVVHIVTPSYANGMNYPDKLRIRSEMFMSGAFSHVLQDVWVYNEDSSGSRVRFNCAGTMPQTAAQSVPNNRITTTTTPC